MASVCEILAREEGAEQVGRRLAVDIAWLWAGYVGRSISYLGMTVVLSRSLGAADFGQLSLFLAFGLGISYLAGSWPFLSIPILCAQGRSLRGVVRTSAMLAAAGTCVAMAIALPLYATSVGSAVPIGALALFSVALVGLQGVYGVMQTMGRMRDIALVQAGERTFALVVLLIILAVGTMTVISAQLALSLAAVLASITTALWLVFQQSSSESPDGRASMRELVKAVGPMAIVSACSYGVAWVDIFLIAAFKSDASVGTYSLWIVATLPRHARASHGGLGLDEQLPESEMLAGSQLWAGAVGIAACVVAVVLPGVFGSDFESSIVPLIILLVGATALAPYFAVVSPLIGSGRTTLMAAVGAVGIGANLVLDLLLIPSLGTVAPAAITAAVTISAAVYLVWRGLGGQRVLAISSRVFPVALLIAILALNPQSSVLRILAALVSIAACAGAARRVIVHGIRTIRSPQPTPTVVEPPQV
jgi:O-antigen/teichoic acid export membrane protein